MKTALIILAVVAVVALACVVVPMVIAAKAGVH